MHTLMAFALLSSFATSPPPLKPMWMRVTTSMMAPAYVKVLVFVEPHPDNRSLKIEVDGPPLYRASEVELEGARAKRAHLLELKAVMAGEYVVRAVVHGNGGVRAVTERHITVIGQ